MDSVQEIYRSFRIEYNKTPNQLKVIDIFILYALVTAATQFLYMVLVGSFPFNSFLAGFLASVGFLTLTVCLRLQLDPESPTTLSRERCFADFAFSNLVLFLLVWNFMG